MPACGQAVGCGVCDTPELWRGAAGLCARVRACAGAAKSLHTYNNTYIRIADFTTAHHHFLSISTTTHNKSTTRPIPQHCQLLPRLHRLPPLTKTKTDKLTQRLAEFFYVHTTYHFCSSRSFALALAASRALVQHRAELVACAPTLAPCSFLYVELEYTASHVAPRTRTSSSSRYNHHAFPPPSCIIGDHQQPPPFPPWSHPRRFPISHSHTLHTLPACHTQHNTRTSHSTAGVDCSSPSCVSYHSSISINTLYSIIRPILSTSIQSVSHTLALRIKIQSKSKYVTKDYKNFIIKRQNLTKVCGGGLYAPPSASASRVLPPKITPITTN